MSGRAWLGLAALFVAFQAPAWFGQPWLLLLFFGVACVVGGRYGLDQRWRFLPAGFAMALAAKGAALLVGRWAGVYRAEAGGGLVWSALVIALPFTFLPSIAEDMLTRGYLYEVAGRRWAPWVFVAVSSVAYVLNHVYRWEEWALLFVFGCAYGAGLVRSGTLWGAVGLHWGWNFANVLYEQAAPVAVVSVGGGRAISAGAHAAMLLFVWWWWTGRDAFSSAPPK